MRFGKPRKNTRRHNPRYHTLTEGVRFENNSNKNMSDVMFYLEEFYPFCQEALGFEDDATVIFESDFKNAKNPLGKTAYYDPANHSISVYVDGRHSKDVMRSVAHELVHHHQNLRGDLQGASMEEGYAQNDEHLREMEREAYEKGNLLFRDWEDHKKNGNSDESLMARIMEKWGYDKASLHEEGGGFEEGQLVKVIGSALVVDGEKSGTVVSFEDPAVTIKLDDDQEGKHVPDDKMVKVKKDYVEVRADSGFAPEMGAPEEETLGEDIYDDPYAAEDFDISSLESEFPWLAKNVKAGEVPPELAAELAAEFGEKESPEGDEEEAPLEEGAEDSWYDFGVKDFQNGRPNKPVHPETHLGPDRQQWEEYKKGYQDAEKGVAEEDLTVMREEEGAVMEFGPFKKGDTVTNADGERGIVQKWDAETEKFYGRPIGPDEVPVFWTKRWSDTGGKDGGQHIERIEDLESADATPTEEDPYLPQGDRPYTAPIDDLEEMVRRSIRSALQKRSTV